MALVKQYVQPNGVTGNYWRITDIAQSTVQDITTVRLALYLNKAKRQESGQYTLPHSVLFEFREGDHPLSELTTPNNLPDNSNAALLKMLYKHIRSVVAASRNIEEANRSQNEHKAIWFDDADDDVE
jgi:hypothetical protein